MGNLGRKAKHPDPSHHLSSPKSIPLMLPVPCLEPNHGGGGTKNPLWCALGNSLRHREL